MEAYQTIKPVYTVYFYTDFLYRVVKFKRSPDALPKLSEPGEDEPTERFLQSYARSRSMVLQYALCNHWDYFITITVDQRKFDRYDLAPIMKTVAQWFRDYRKSFGNIRYLLVPERHKDGAWHFHGLISGILPSHLFEFVRGVHPRDLVDAGYLNFPMLADIVGYVSLGQLRDSVGTAFYVTKYVTKEHARDGLYEHLYYCSHGLKRARPVADCYVYNAQLEGCLTQDNEFCCTGWARDIQDFTFPFSFPGLEPRDLVSLDLEQEQRVLSVVDYYEGMQLSIEDLLRDVSNGSWSGSQPEDAGSISAPAPM